MIIMMIPYGRPTISYSVTSIEPPADLHIYVHIT